jgi:hypothetical protein
MEQSFLLKHYGHLSINEQMDMTAEERNWWLERLDKENKNQKNSEQTKPTHTPGTLPT